LHLDWSKFAENLQSYGRFAETLQKWSVFSGWRPFLLPMGLVWFFTSLDLIKTVNFGAASLFFNLMRPFLTEWRPTTCYNTLISSGRPVPQCWPPQWLGSDLGDGLWIACSSLFIWSNWIQCIACFLVAGNGSVELELIDWRLFTRQHGHLVAADPVVDPFGDGHPDPGRLNQFPVWGEAIYHLPVFEQSTRLWTIYSWTGSARYLETSIEC